MYVQCNIEVLSRNHCYSGREKGIKHCVCILALAIRRATGIFSVQLNIVICGLSIYTMFSLMIS